MAGRIIQVEERVPLLKGIPLSIQHTFAMFSVSVLVPWFFGINAAIVLLMNGIGHNWGISSAGRAPALHIKKQTALLYERNFLAAEIV